MDALIIAQVQEPCGLLRSPGKMFKPVDSVLLVWYKGFLQTQLRKNLFTEPFSDHG